MRDILFRGKRTDNGEWVEGFYAKAKHIISEKEMHIIFQLGLELFPHSEFSSYEEVDPATISRYTELEDKNGKRIFEGDILQVHNFPLCENSFSNCVVAYGIFSEFGSNSGKEMVGFYLYWTSEGEAYHKLPNLKWWLEERGAVCIGNIHDNPELLKEK